MKKKGFILPFTLLILGFVLTVFHLFNLSLNSTTSLNLLEEKNRILKSDFMNLNDVVRYEFEIMSNHIQNGEVESIDYYFFYSPTGESLWSNEMLRKEKSIGGYSIVKTSPPIETLSIGYQTDVEFFFHKKIEISDENNEKYMTVTVKLDKIKMKCTLLNSEKEMTCEVKERIVENINIVGEL